MTDKLIPPLTACPAHACRQGLVALALVLALAGCGGQDTTPVEELTSEQRLARPANVINGENLFYTCAVCHDTQASFGHRIGPNLAGIYEAPAARHGDFSYSSAMKNAGIVWDEETLDAFLTRPSALIPRNRMAFPGEPDAANRRDMIAYLKTLK